MVSKFHVNKPVLIVIVSQLFACLGEGFSPWFLCQRNLGIYLEWTLAFNLPSVLSYVFSLPDNDINKRSTSKWMSNCSLHCYSLAGLKLEDCQNSLSEPKLHCLSWISPLYPCKTAILCGKATHHLVCRLVARCSVVGFFLCSPAD